MANLTITDIAEKAGVSKATVSRVLNHKGVVGAETRERVLAIIAENNYSPSAAARNLSKGVFFSTIGFVVPEIDNPFFGSILRSAIESMDRNSLIPICYNSDDEIEKDFRILKLLREYEVRGILYTPACDYSQKRDRLRLQQILKEINVPVVLMDRNIRLEGADVVYFNDYQGIYNATKALIEKGHTRIAIIDATLDRVLPRNRQGGYEAALRDSGLSLNRDYIFYGNYDMKKAYQVSMQMLDMKDRPTAVITGNNTNSKGFLKALYERGEVLERDIVCIGLDKLELLDYVGIPFNYLERDAGILGKKAMELLLDRLACPDRETKEVLLEPELVIKKL